MSKQITVDRETWERVMTFVRSYVKPCGNDPLVLCLNHGLTSGGITDEQWQAFLDLPRAYIARSSALNGGNTMSETERATGATDEQIAAAAVVADSYATHFDWRNDRDAETFIEDITNDMCAAIVPPGYRIVPADAVLSEAEREDGGRFVRQVWVDYCRETGDTKPSHSAPWEELSAWDKEVDRRIYEAVFRRIVARGGGGG